MTFRIENFLFWKNFKKTPFRYVSSIVIMYSRETARVKVLLSKGCMVAVRNYSANTTMEKKTEGGGGRVKDNESSRVKQKI